MHWVELNRIERKDVDGSTVKLRVASKNVSKVRVAMSEFRS